MYVPTHVHTCAHVTNVSATICCYGITYIDYVLGQVCDMKLVVINPYTYVQQGL